MWGLGAATLHRPKAVADMGAAAAARSGAATVARMEAVPPDDDAFGPGGIRPDGASCTPAHPFRVKAPAESRGPWAYYEPMAPISADQAFRPLARAGARWSAPAHGPEPVDAGPDALMVAARSGTPRPDACAGGRRRPGRGRPG